VAKVRERPSVIPKGIEEDKSIRCVDIVFEVSIFDEVLDQNNEFFFSEVEKCFFKVPRQWFKDSPLFCEIFELPVAENAVVDGSSIERPFRLFGINQTDFKLLLRLMASRLVILARNERPTILTEHSYGREESLSVHDWTSILKLSVMWNFPDIKKTAIKKVFHNKTLDPLTKISLARNYGLSEELLHSLGLFTGRQLIRMEDTEALSMDYIVKILEIQECIDPAFAIKCAFCNDVLRDRSPTLRQSYDFTEPLNSIFQEELKLLKRSSEKDAKTAEPEPVDLKMFDKFNADIFFLVSDRFLFDFHCLCHSLAAFFRSKIAFSKVLVDPLGIHLFSEICLTSPSLRM
jgi:hypothetical protein